MADKRKKLAYMIAAQTGCSYQGAHNVMRAALAGDAEAQKKVDAAKKELAEDRAGERVRR